MSDDPKTLGPDVQRPNWSGFSVADDRARKFMQDIANASRLAPEPTEHPDDTDKDDNR